MSLDPKQLAENALKIAKAAVTMEKQTGVPAEFAAGQCCQESGWGRKSPGNNPFGIKFHTQNIPTLGRPPKKQVFKTFEYFTDAQAARFKANGKRIEATGEVLNGKRRYTVWDEFCAYDSFDEAFLDYARLVTSGKFFKKSWEEFQVNKDRDAFFRKVAAVYATDPNYYTNVMNLVKGKRLSAALLQARQELG